MGNKETSQEKEIEELKLENQQLKRKLKRAKEIVSLAQMYMTFKLCSCGSIRIKENLCSNEDCKEV